MPSIVKFIQNKLKGFTNRPHCRALVFVQRIEHGIRVAGDLGCDFYRGSTDKDLSNQEREAMVTRWINGVHNIMVATDAFGPGNDYPYVQQVFFVASPRGIVDFLQMAGRGGRSGQVASIYTFLLHDTMPFTSNTAISAHLGALELAPLFKKPTFRCWRLVFGKFLDGVSLPCKAYPFNWLCPACRKQEGPQWSRPFTWTGPNDTLITPILPSPLLITTEWITSPLLLAKTRGRAPSILSLVASSPATALVIPPRTPGAAFVAPVEKARKYRRTAEEKDQYWVDVMKNAIQVFEGRCSVCQFMNPNKLAIQHPRTIFNCTRMQSIYQMTAHNTIRTLPYIDWRNKIRYPNGSGHCYTCHLPFLNDRVHGAKVGGDKGCKKEHDDMVGPVVWTAFLWKETREELKAKFEQQWATDIEYSQWLVQKDKVLIHGEQAVSKVTNMCRVFIWAADRVRDILKQ